MTTTEQDPNTRDGELLAPSGVTFTALVGGNNVEMMFRRRVQGRRLPHVFQERVPVSDVSRAVLGPLECLLEESDDVDGGGRAWILRDETGDLTLVSLGDGWGNVATASDDPDRARATCAQVAQQIRAPQDFNERTPITFWALDTHHTPKVMQRKIQALKWEPMLPNYSQTTRAGMARLLELDHSPDERMILWHGPSGTGKTHALRALAHGWRDWCDIAFVTDPETFVGGSPAYLFEVINFNAGHSAEEAEKRSTLIVLEDAGELMKAEARETTGQGLSRLLNLTDGLMGQGLNVMVLITTNEPLGTLHPAVVRAGRCLAEMEFGPLSPEQANDWLEEHDSGVTVEQPTTLANLYAIITGIHPTMSAAGVS
jgi:hypothetical protein